MDMKSFNKLPIMGILRGIEEKEVKPLTETIINSGLKTVEIAMNTPGANKLIRKMIKLSEGHLTVGAGTVLNMRSLMEALDAGAKFIVMPAFIRDVVEHCVRSKIHVFPGAFSPQEIYTAWESGATMVKVFPAKFFGPAYFKEIKGPFQDIKLLACGGVNRDNIGSFFSCGASAVAFGSSIFKRDLIKEKRYTEISDNLSSLIVNFSKN